MTKSNFHSVLSILIASWFLFLSTGFTINYHFCQDKLQSWKIYVQPENCHTAKNAHCAEKQTEAACHQAQKSCCQAKIAKKNCCQDGTDFVKLTTEHFPTQQEQTNIAESELAGVHSYMQVTSFQQDIRISAHYKNYKPPLLFEDIPVLTQSFRI